MLPTVIRTYDYICFGDEVPGLLAIVAAAREHRRQTGRLPRSLVLHKANNQGRIGGHLVRGELTYLDRSHVPLSLRQNLGIATFGEPAAIYQEFLQRAGVNLIALDPAKADTALRQMLSEVGADLLGAIEIATVLKEGQKIIGIDLTKGERYLGKQFIDATVNAELAQAAGARKLPGYASLGLPNSELPVTLVFETAGLSIQQLRATESIYLERFNNPNDVEAQGWFAEATGGDRDLMNQLRQDFVDSQGRLKPMYVGPDYIDVRTKALSIAYHAYRGKKLSLSESGAILDNGNVAILPGGRLSWNAFLYRVNAAEAEALARKAAKPSAAILQEMQFIQRWFTSLGATAVRPAAELYIRHAGNIADVMEPLSGTDMLAGGVNRDHALGTFGYAFDVRGGIEGLFERAADLGINDLRFDIPLFNIGIRHAIPKTVPNLAVISPASGFTGYASSAGRIVEYNVGVGQGVGIACAIATLSNRNLADVANLDVRSILARTNRLPKIYGQNYTLAASRLGDFEQRIVGDVLVASNSGSATRGVA